MDCRQRTLDDGFDSLAVTYRASHPYSICAGGFTIAAGLLGGLIDSGSRKCAVCEKDFLRTAAEGAKFHPNVRFKLTSKEWLESEIISE